MADSAKQVGSWTDAFPSPVITAPLISREEILPDISSPDLLIVDVRRTDYEGGAIKGSLNLPAHSFYMNRATLYNLCLRAGVKRVAFYCGKPDLSYYPCLRCVVILWREILYSSPCFLRNPKH